MSSGRKVLKERKIGKLDTSFATESNALRKCLGKRLSMDQFQQRFATRDAFGESLYLKTAKLGELLKKRPDRKRLSLIGVIQEGSKASSLHGIQNQLRKNQRTDRLNKLIGSRPERNKLGAFGVIQEDASFRAASLHKIQSQLMKNQKMDKLNRHLGMRPTRKEVHKKFELLSIDESSEMSEPLVEAEEVRSPSAENFNKARSSLALFVSNRPAPETLLENNILEDLQILTGCEEEETEAEITITKLESLENIKLVSSGNSYTLAVNAEGHAYTLGTGSHGELGHGTSSDESHPEPTILQTLKDIGAVTSVSCGDAHSAVVCAGKVYSWGTGKWGRLGLGDEEDRNVPTIVDLGEEVAVEVCCGSYHTLVLTESSKLFAFGWNKQGRIGVGESSDIVSTPIEVSFPSDVKIKAVGTGNSSSWAIDVNGNLYTWGSGVWGGLGHGDECDQYSPKKVEGISGVVLAAAGSSYGIASCESGEVYSYGTNKYGELGRHTDYHFDTLPGLVDIGKDGKVSHICCGKRLSAIIKGSKLYTFGKRIVSPFTNVPTLAEGLKDLNVDVVCTNWTHAAAVANGSVYCWGFPAHWQ